MFHQEIAALDWRVHELGDVVDDFVIVESVLTHSGMPRELVHPELDDRFAWLGNRLHAVVDSDPPTGPDHWARERHQRTAIWTLGAAPLSTADDDLIVISDLDEVPYPEIIDKLAWSAFEFPVFLCPHWFNFNWQTFLGRWDHWSIRCYPAGVLRAAADAGHHSDIGGGAIPGRLVHEVGGWHASWFGSDEALLAKLNAYAHASDERDIQAISEGITGVQARRASGRDMHDTRTRLRRRTPRLPVYGHLLTSTDG
ncbi:MAG: hypothetical protein KF883_15575 [Thermomicrobiales bacterium]|nr:hypothetical protein [Thermomicrobiales bacterium]